MRLGENLDDCLVGVADLHQSHLMVGLIRQGRAVRLEGGIPACGFDVPAVDDEAQRSAVVGFDDAGPLCIRPAAIRLSLVSRLVKKLSVSS
jgi:hypothetical protein